MSHVASVEITIKDLDSLDAACTKLGLELVRGQETFKWFGRFLNDWDSGESAYKHGIKPEDYGKCSHAIRIPGDSSAYEIGVVKNPNGEGFVLVFDVYCQRKLLEIVGGNDCRKLADRYAAEVAIKEMCQQGYSHTESWNAETQEIELEFCKF